MPGQEDARPAAPGYPMIPPRPPLRSRIGASRIVLLVAALAAVIGVVALVAIPGSAAGPRRGGATTERGPCGDPIARSQELVARTVLGGPAGGQCAPTVPTAPTPTPSPSPSGTPTPTPTPARTTAPADRYCRVTLRVPSAARVHHAVRIRVVATQACFTGPTRTLDTHLRSSSGHPVAVRWTSRGGRHDIVLRHGVPRPGRWRLDLSSGPGLAAQETGVLVARR